MCILSDIHFCYGAADGNGTEVRSLYTEKYPNRTIPSAKIFCRIDQWLRDTSTLKPAKSSGRVQHGDLDLGKYCTVSKKIQEEKDLCKWMSRKIQRNSNFPVRILFTDETTFNKCGITNIRNEHF